MWIARNRLGDLRVFEFPPRRFHSGSCLSSEDTGFNDDVYIGNGKDDTYSFWAIQKYYESDVIDDHASYGLALYKSSNEKDIICKQYEPSWAKNLKWEDEPIEVKLEVVHQHIKPDEYMDEADMIEMESMGIRCRINGGFVYNSIMWVARDKDDNLNLFEDKPERCDSVGGQYNGDKIIQIIPGVWRIRNPYGGFYSTYGFIKIDNTLFPDLKWEDEPIEVMVESLEELRKGQIDYKTKQIESLTRVFRGVALEDVGDILNDLEEKIHSKYKMIGNPYCNQNCRMVTIPYSSIQLGDNSLHEYIVDDKVVVTIYIRRNDFNNADILVSDLGGEYVDSKR